MYNKCEQCNIQEIRTFKVVSMCLVHKCKSSVCLCECMYDYDSSNVHPRWVLLNITHSLTSSS